MKKYESFSFARENPYLNGVDNKLFSKRKRPLINSSTRRSLIFFCCQRCMRCYFFLKVKRFQRLGIHQFSLKTHQFHESCKCHSKNVLLTSLNRFFHLLHPFNSKKFISFFSISSRLSVCLTEVSGAIDKVSSRLLTSSRNFCTFSVINHSHRVLFKIRKRKFAFLGILLTLE